MSARRNDRPVLSGPEPAVMCVHPQTQGLHCKGVPCPFVLKLPGSLRFPGSAEGQIHTELKAPPLQRHTASEQASRTFYILQVHVWGRKDRGP